MNNHYSVTKTFVTGSLAGLTITETTKVSFEVGRIYKECRGSGSYKVVACIPQAAVRVGAKVICNGFEGAIRIVHEGQLKGMADVQLDRGQVCVGISTLKFIDGQTA